jgi:hypothetical protein
MSNPNSGSIAISVFPQANGCSVCEVTPTLEGRTARTERFLGANPKHAIAIALENLARTFRMEAEAEQKIAWNAVKRSTSGQTLDERFHVILHDERVAWEESKFEAIHNTRLGNTVVENAEFTAIRVDPDLPIKLLDHRRK